MFGWLTDFPRHGARSHKAAVQLCSDGLAIAAALCRVAAEVGSANCYCSNRYTSAMSSNFLWSASPAASAQIWPRLVWSAGRGRSSPPSVSLTSPAALHSVTSSRLLGPHSQFVVSYQTSISEFRPPHCQQPSSNFEPKLHYLYFSKL